MMGTYCDKMPGGKWRGDNSRAPLTETLVVAIALETAYAMACIIKGRT